MYGSCNYATAGGLFYVSRQITMTLFSFLMLIQFSTQHIEIFHRTAFTAESLQISCSNYLCIKAFLKHFLLTFTVSNTLLNRPCSPPVAFCVISMLHSSWTATQVLKSDCSLFLFQQPWVPSRRVMNNDPLVSNTSPYTLRPKPFKRGKQSRYSVLPLHIFPVTSNSRSLSVHPGSPSQTHTPLGSQLVRKEPVNFVVSGVSFVSPKHPSLSSSPLCFSHSCSFTFTVQCSLLFAFLENSLKWGETRPLGCSTASPLLQVSPLFQFPLSLLSFSPTLSPSLLPRLILAFS